MRKRFLLVVPLVAVAALTLHGHTAPALAVVERLPSLDSLWSARSPGPRGVGVLLQTKQPYRRHPAPCRPHVERQPAVYAVSSPPLVIDHGVSVPSSAVDVGLAPLDSEATGWSGVPPLVVHTPPVIVWPGRPVTPPVSPVPEPGTWALMIGGLGLVGGVMRRASAAGETA